MSLAKENKKEKANFSSLGDQETNQPAVDDFYSLADHDTRQVNLLESSPMPDQDISSDEAALSRFFIDDAEIPTKSDINENTEDKMPSAHSRIPLIGYFLPERQRKILFSFIALGILGFILAAILSVSTAINRAKQIDAVGEVLTQSQRVAKSLTQALLGKEKSFNEVVESSKIFAANTKGLQLGDNNTGINPVSGDAKKILDPLLPLVDKTKKNIDLVISKKNIIIKANQALADIKTHVNEMLNPAEEIVKSRIESGQASTSELLVLSQLTMLTQRIGKSANELITIDGISSDAVFFLGKDLNTLKELINGLTNGNAELKIFAVSDPYVREQLRVLQKLFDDANTQSGVILNSLDQLISVRDAESSVLKDNDPLRSGFQLLRQELTSVTGIGIGNLVLLIISLLLTTFAGVALLRLNVKELGVRAKLAEFNQRQAQSQEMEAKLVNDANQTAILRLMNELQSVSEGDLTQRATVTEDITGAIADSVNFTVEELSRLVSQVQNTVDRVIEKTEKIDDTSTELLAASTEQLTEIRQTGDSILHLAGRILEVSGRAQESAQVARQSMAAADLGLRAVQNSIGGMQIIREQIQDTSKRIKRLGESSQEIGEITDLISDITDQTNVLALNAAIQAASAGEAGRGFSVVAEEVQRLAERSGNATRQIAALVRAIQADTQDAVDAMERSTQKVVEGAQLSDNAGSALNEIDLVSRKLADLIESISVQATNEANSANQVVTNIQQIFAVTEQTGEGTRSTAQLVRDLSKVAEELRLSVSRFKVI